jgi:hypothetical protein
MSGFDSKPTSPLRCQLGRSGGGMTGGFDLAAIDTESVVVDDNVTGFVWSVPDVAVVARLIAIVLLGQAQHAARIIAALEPAVPAFVHGVLIADAKRQMMIRGEDEETRQAHRAHRDGFLFECLSWIAARQEATDRTFLKDPHIDATSHGLDGLIVELHPTDSVVRRATICEDKCTTRPRRLFREQVMATFAEHHANKRARDLVANAAAIIRETGIDGTAAVVAAAAVLEASVRCYRAALTTPVLTEPRRQRLFRGYDDLGGITQAQRVGAMFEIDGDLREWFEALADEVLASLDELEAELDAADV